MNKKLEERKPGSGNLLSRRSFLEGALAAGVLTSAASFIGCKPSSSEGDAVSTEVSSGKGTASETLIPTTFPYTYHQPVAGEIAYIEKKITDTDITDTLKCDVVICGAGLAGASAALSAAENGLQVVVLEKSPNASGRGAQLGAIGSKVQTAAGTDPIDNTEFVDDAMMSVGYRADRKVWERYAGRCGEAADWLVEILGGACGKWGADSPHHITNSGIRSWGDTITPEKMMGVVAPAEMDIAPDLGIDIRYETPAVQLIQESNGSVSGVIAKTSDGGYLKVVATKGVVLATGGYENNWKLLCENVEPRRLAVATWRNPTTTNTGDGHLMGLAAGAAIDDYPHVMMNDPGASVSSHTYCRPLAQAFLRVNEQGKRFVNEGASPEYVSAAISDQTGAHCFVIIGGDLKDNLTELFTKRRLPWSVDDMVTAFTPELVKAETIEELAKTCGIDSDNLKTTIAANNTGYDTQKDSEYGKDASCLLPIKEGPYYACEEGSAALVTVSGLKIDDHSQVLDTNGNIIPGLYALGNVSGSMFNSYYPHHLQANSHGRCVTFGYLLGRNLAGVE